MSTTWVTAAMYEGYQEGREAAKRLESAGVPVNFVPGLLSYHVRVSAQDVDRAKCILQPQNNDND